MEEEKRGYYAIIPAVIRYDESITPNAKLLYGEITALCNEKGYCWASNKYFANLYGVSNVSISKWINQLAEAGYIDSTIAYKEGSKEIEGRYLRIVNDPIKENFNTLLNKTLIPSQRKVNDPIKEKFKDNNTDNNNTLNTTFNNTTNKRKAPVVYYPNDEKLDSAFKDFVEMRKKSKSPMTEKAIELAIKHLEELSGGDNDVAIEIIEQSIMNGWKGLFTLKEQKQAKKASSIIDEWMNA